MKQTQTLAFTAILAVAVGMIGFNGVYADLFTADTTAVDSDQTGLSGHVVMTHFDKDGNIKSYQQSDNVVTFVGKNCAANLLFGTGFANCTAPGAFDYIAISETVLSGIEVQDVATVLTGECSACGTGLNARIQGAVTASVAGADEVDPIVEITSTFTLTSASTPTIASAGLFDAATTGNMFAVKNFGSTVPLTQDESLKVDWLITLAAPTT